MKKHAHAAISSINYWICYEINAKKRFKVLNVPNNATQLPGHKVDGTDVQASLAL